MAAAQRGRGGAPVAGATTAVHSGPPPRKAAARQPAGKATKKTAAKKATAGHARSSVPGRGRGPGKDDLRQLSKAQLYKQATDQDIAGRSKMSRSQLIDALAHTGRQRTKSPA